MAETVKKGKKNTTIILLIVALLVAIWFFFIKKKKETVSTAITSTDETKEQKQSDSDLIKMLLDELKNKTVTNVTNVYETHNSTATNQTTENNQTSVTNQTTENNQTVINNETVINNNTVISDAGVSYPPIIPPVVIPPVVTPPVVVIPPVVTPPVVVPPVVINIPISVKSINAYMSRLSFELVPGTNVVSRQIIVFDQDYVSLTAISTPTTDNGVCSFNLKSNTTSTQIKVTSLFENGQSRTNVYNTEVPLSARPVIAVNEKITFYTPTFGNGSIGFKLVPGVNVVSHTVSVSDQKGSYLSPLSYSSAADAVLVYAYMNDTQVVKIDVISTFADGTKSAYTNSVQVRTLEVEPRRADDPIAPGALVSDIGTSHSRGTSISGGNGTVAPIAVIHVKTLTTSDNGVSYSSSSVGGGGGHVVPSIDSPKSKGVINNIEKAR